MINSLKNGLSFGGIIKLEELDRFKKKASSYRQALEDQPTSRLLELYPILWYLEKHGASTGKSRKRLRIVDLMSGSGFLSENLFKLGFHDLHAVEFCEEMHKDATVYYSKARLHSLSSFDHLDSVLDAIQPDVIITLASFHHLIVYNSNDSIDKDASTSLQSFVVDICMRSLPDHGILLIADLMENEITETPLEPFRNPMKRVAKRLHGLGVDAGIAAQLGKTNSLHGASSLLHREFGVKSGNKSLEWFRKVVDQKTSVGHKDIALSEEFLQRVSSYRPIITKYACPWIFENEAALSDFVYKKFAFVLDSGTPNSLSKEEVLELAKENLGVRKNRGSCALGWNLGIVLLGKLEPFAKDRKFYKYLNSLIFMATILVMALLLRYFADIYEKIGPKDLLVFLFTLPIGVMLCDLITKSNKIE